MDNDQHEIDDLVKIFANTKAQRWIKLAFILSMRKQVMMQINDFSDSFVWNKQLDINSCIDAKKLIDMNDYYIVGLHLIPATKKSKRSGYVTPNSRNISTELDGQQQSQLLMHQLKTKIVDIMVTESTVINEFQISTADLTKKIPRKRFKQCNNMDNIKSIINEFVNAKLITAFDPPQKKKNNTRYSKIIQRNQLSTLSLTDSEKRIIKKIFVKYGLVHLLITWGSGWGFDEIKYMRSIENLQI